MTGRLAGWRILVPRPSGRASRLLSELDSHGASAQVVSLLTVVPPTDPARLDAAMLALAAGDYHWVVFTSGNSVAAATARSADLALSPTVPADTRVAAVGPATASALRAVGVPVDLISRGGSALALAAEFPRAAQGGRLLLPQSELAPQTLADGLAAKGWAVDRVGAYRTVPTPPSPSVAEDLRGGRFEAVLLTSASTVTALDGIAVPAGTLIGAIGESTAAAIRRAGRAVGFVAASPTEAGLLAALLDAADRRSVRSPGSPDPATHLKEQS